MKKIFLKIVIGVVLACILFVCFLYTNNEIGVTSSKLEADIRSSQKIKDDWTVDGSVSSTMAAYISYPQDLSDHSFSVYVNRPGLSFGYFFRGGGTLSGIQRGIVEFTVEGYNERAFISISTPVSSANARPGDLIFFVGTYDTPGVSHVGIYVGGGKMLHCGDPIQYADINTSYWQSHFYAFGRPPYN